MWKVEHTDTFGGEANYCWLNTLELSDKLAKSTIIRKAKEFAGFKGWCRTWTSDMGDFIEIRPTKSSGIPQIAFITWEEDHV